jgi:hypothetical protein
MYSHYLWREGGRHRGSDLLVLYDDHTVANLQGEKKKPLFSSRFGSGRIATVCYSAHL